MFSSSGAPFPASASARLMSARNPPQLPPGLPEQDAVGGEQGHLGVVGDQRKARLHVRVVALYPHPAVPGPDAVIGQKLHRIAQGVPRSAPQQAAPDPVPIGLPRPPPPLHKQAVLLRLLGILLIVEVPEHLVKAVEIVLGGALQGGQQGAFPAQILLLGPGAIPYAAAGPHRVGEVQHQHPAQGDPLIVAPIKHILFVPFPSHDPPRGGKAVLVVCEIGSPPVEIGDFLRLLRLQLLHPPGAQVDGFPAVLRREFQAETAVVPWVAPIADDVQRLA